VDAIVETRKKKGRYTDFLDFLRKVPLVVCNKRTIESLAKAGAFDSLGHTRRGLVADHEAEIDIVVGLKRNEAIGQDALFGGLNGSSEEEPAEPYVSSVEEWDKQTLLAHEREMLGLYVSDHPLFGLEHVLEQFSDCTIGALLTDEDRPDGSVVAVAGLITGLNRKITKKGDSWAIVTLEDL